MAWFYVFYCNGHCTGIDYKTITVPVIFWFTCVFTGYRAIRAQKLPSSTQRSIERWV